MNMDKYKSVRSPTTEADYHVQTMIVQGLKRFFPLLKVVGEEEQDFKGEIKVSYDHFHMDFCPLEAKFGTLEVPYDELCAWIDPIDGTYAFVDGRMDYVTSLIGLARNQLAYAGVIGMPFQKIG